MKNNICVQYHALSEEKKKAFLERLNTQGEKYGIFPLTVLQCNLLFSYLTNPEDSSYNIRFLMHFSSELNTKVLQQAVSTVIYRNPALRTRLLVLDDEYYQYIEPWNEEIALDTVKKESMEEVYQALAKSGIQAFCLEDEIPIRCCLYELRDEFALAVCIHHMFCDGWSVEIITKEIRECYQTYLAQGTLPDLSPKKAYYRAYQVDDSEACNQYWKHCLREYRWEMLRLPVARKMEDHTKAVKKVYRFVLDDMVNVEAVAREYHVTPYCLTLGVYLQALHQWCRQSEVFVGIAVLNRHSDEERNTVGLYANTLPVFHVAKQVQDMMEYYGQLKQQLHANLEYSGVDLEKVQSQMGAVAKRKENGLYQSVFLSAETVREKVSFGDGWMYLENIENSNRIQFDVICCLEQAQNQYMIRLDYRSPLLQESEIQRLEDIYQDIYGKVIKHEKLIQDMDWGIVVKPDGLAEDVMENEGDAPMLGTVRAVWEQLLGNDNFSDEDNFFVVGGNSVLCIKMVSQLNRQLNEKIKITDVFKYCTIRSLAGFLSTQGKTEKQKKPATVIQL